MTIAKLEWDDVTFINSLRPEESTDIQIQEIDGAKKYVLTFDLKTVIAKREEELARHFDAMRIYNNAVETETSYFEDSRKL